MRGCNAVHRGNKEMIATGDAADSMDAAIQLVSCASAPSTFMLARPQSALSSTSKPAFDRKSDSLAGTETILLAEDDAMVRDVTAKGLRKRGYNVLEATDGIEALNIVQSYEGCIALLLTDVIMPRLDGIRLLHQVRAMLPQIGVLMFSGYSEEIFPGEVICQSRIRILPKPFAIAELLCNVRELIDSQKPAISKANAGDSDPAETYSTDLSTAA